MKYFIGVLFFLSLQASASPDSTAADRRELHDLLMERHEKFELYARSLAKKSGFFGNKTKADLRASHDMLADIVETDNKIIRTLNRVVDFRNYEKANMNYDLRDRDIRLEGLLHAADTLSKKAEALTKQNQLLERQITLRTIFIYLLAAAALFLYFVPGIKKK